jgi:hypothetical protein
MLSIYIKYKQMNDKHTFDETFRGTREPRRRGATTAISKKIDTTTNGG